MGWGKRIVKKAKETVKSPRKLLKAVAFPAAAAYGVAKGARDMFRANAAAGEEEDISAEGFMPKKTLKQRARADAAGQGILRYTEEYEE